MKRVLYRIWMPIMLVTVVCMWNCDDTITDNQTNRLPTDIPDYQIVYQTSDNTGISFKNGDTFGNAKIVSNRYSKDKGYWTIEFDNMVTRIGTEAFKECSKLTHIVIPKYVGVIGDKAFYKCSNLRSITILGKVKTLQFWTFGYCTNLTSFVIPESVRNIEQFSFGFCSKLDSITIPQSVTGIDLSAFNGCDNLTHMKVDEGNSVYDSRDNCNAIVHTRTNTLIAGCRTTVIPHTVTDIGLGAFKACSTLTEIDIPSSVTTISAYAFENCINLKEIVIPNSVIHMQNHVFLDCTNLSSVKLPASIEYIREYTFKNCTSLTHITIPASIKEIEPSAFEGCSNLTNITVAEENKVFDSRDQCNAIVETATNTLKLGCIGTTIPTSVTVIGNNAFENCYGLKSITIPRSIVEIGYRSFKGCKDLIEVHCKAETPPKNSYQFSQIFLDTPNPIIYVSPHAIEEYKKHYFWGTLNLQVSKEE